MFICFLLNWSSSVAPTGGWLHVLVIKDGPILKGGPIMSVVWRAASIPAVVFSSVGIAADDSLNGAIACIVADRS